MIYLTPLSRSPSQKKRMDTERQDCVICMESLMNSYHNPPKPKLRLPCHPAHVFHSNCIHEWLDRNASCPICRTSCGATLSGEESHSFVSILEIPMTIIYLSYVVVTISVVTFVATMCTVVYSILDLQVGGV